jgi:hypothetical protein
MISQNVGLYPHGKIERAEPGNIETGQVGPGGVIAVRKAIFSGGPPIIRQPGFSLAIFVSGSVGCS